MTWKCYYNNTGDLSFRFPKLSNDSVITTDAVVDGWNNITPPPYVKIEINPEPELKTLPEPEPEPEQEQEQEQEPEPEPEPEINVDEFLDDIDDMLWD